MRGIMKGDPPPAPVAEATPDGSVAEAPASDAAAPAPDLPEGLVIEDLRVGEGPVVTPQSSVFMRLTGTVEGAEPFQRIEEPAGPWPVAGLIDGLGLGVVGMAEGGLRRITIPPALGYGSTEVRVPESGATIPPGSVLVYDIEIVRVLPQDGADGQAAGGEE